MNIPESTVAPALISAYRATQYCITSVDDPFVLHIDEPSADLARCHDDHGVRTSAILTAYNPHSQPTPEAANEAAQLRLTAHLQARQWLFLEGLGVDPTGDWPAEPSLLVLGLTLTEARAIGDHFAQNALVWAAEDSTPRLVLLR